jgi:hypothetical protein
MNQKRYGAGTRNATEERSKVPSSMCGDEGTRYHELTRNINRIPKELRQDCGKWPEANPAENRDVPGGEISFEASSSKQATVCRIEP